MRPCPSDKQSVTAALARRVLLPTRALLAASLGCVIAWALVTIAKRPLDGVEGDVLFEADRIRSGLALYVDPTAGAPEYGAPPARYLVLYPPLWSAVLSLVPRSMAIVFGRLLAAVVWFGAIALIAARAPAERRRTVLTLGAFVGGIWVLALYGASARPDAAAIFFSAFALERVARRSAEAKAAPAFDVIAGVAFALAAWTKPNVIGALPGVTIGTFLAARGSAREKILAIVPGGLAVLLTSLAIAATLHIVSHGAWLTHLLSSTGQPPNASLWFEQLSNRGPFFLLPLGFALVLGLRARRDPGALVATSALATSLSWALLSLAKTGSATNYFLEPCIAMLVVASRVDIPALAPSRALGLLLLAFAQVAWDGVGSISGAIAGISSARERALTLADARATCGAKNGDVVIADEPGLELALDGRIVMTPFQTTHRVRRGTFSEDLWLEDLASPNVTCLVMQDDLLERSLGDERPAHDRFTPNVRRALRSRFELAEKSAGYFIYRLREPVGR